MTRISATSLKATLPFAQGNLPKLDPNDPTFIIDLGGVEISGRLNPKAIRKLAAHRGGAVLQGKMQVETGKLVLLDAGFQLLERRPATPATPASPAPPQPSPAAPREGGQP
jgi:hypothetical protein